MNQNIVRNTSQNALAAPENVSSVGDGFQLLSQIFSGGLTTKIAGVTLTQNEKDDREEKSDRLILSIRHEQVQTVERSFRFVGAKLRSDEQPSVDSNRSEVEPELIATEDIKIHGMIEVNLRHFDRIVQIIEVSMFIILGAIIAVFVSPFSPFASVAPTLLIIVLPIGALAVVVQALVYQHRHRIVG